ncbi:ribosomal protection-like ABC-F family protein [Saccharicrinis sp. FJH62]|uniref:ribosomal protection-like ABC-F family protein n=1 Tax=Saccharicrinis sp. FJH62 TaxID=3344657 RepID=UPI0035D42183
MLSLQNVSYKHPNKDLLFETINLTVSNHQKVALIGNNGIGKSTLLKLIANQLSPHEGQIIVDARPYYIPQIFGQYNDQTVAQSLQVEAKLKALKEILKGKVSDKNYALLNDDWSIEERCKEALDYWQISNLDLSQKMGTLSGGQKMKVLLAGIFIHQSGLVLLDEPSNHLDISGRTLLYRYIESTKSALVIVSHDRKLLNLLNTVCELGKHGISVYGGNYEFYALQKQIENNALAQDIQSKEKALRKARKKEQDTLERQQKLNNRGKKKHAKAGTPKVMMNKMKNDSENSTSKIKSVHAEKIGGISRELQVLRSSQPDIDKMKFDFDNSALHQGKIMFTATNINFSYSTEPLWSENLNFQIRSGERHALKGLNGSGKTTLIKLILGELEPQTGTIYRANARSVYIDQDFSMIDNTLNVYTQAQRFNVSSLQEHEIKIRLNRFLFPKNDWDKPCSALSGGERMRLMICCLNIKNQSPDIMILDEPTNNLDIQNIEILTTAINEYRGTLIVISHDEYFLEQLNAEQTIEL